MKDIVTIDKPSEQSCEAFGHPSECTEPAPGKIQQSGSHGVTITNTDGETKEVATIKQADMHFPKHAHDYSIEDGCHNKSSHTLDPSFVSPSVTINGSPVYLVRDSVQTDPDSGGSINIVQAGINKSVTQV